MVSFFGCVIGVSELLHLIVDSLADGPMVRAISGAARERALAALRLR